MAAAGPTTLRPSGYAWRGHAGAERAKRVRRSWSGAEAKTGCHFQQAILQSQSGKTDTDPDQNTENNPMQGSGAVLGKDASNDAETFDVSGKSPAQFDHGASGVQIDGGLKSPRLHTFQATPSKACCASSSRFHSLDTCIKLSTFVAIAMRRHERMCARNTADDRLVEILFGWRRAAKRLR